jgi:hypothetical protein
LNQENAGPAEIFEAVRHNNIGATMTGLMLIIFVISTKMSFQIIPKLEGGFEARRSLKTDHGYR